MSKDKPQKNKENIRLRREKAKRRWRRFSIQVNGDLLNYKK
jgi:hypothetical protein